ncbi:MAG: glycerophosphodiester phosphodiesterase family protein, partial [Mycobacterium sp.]
MTVAVGVLATPPTAAAQPPEFDLQAHRGGRGETTESSLRAFGKSLELGVSTLEFDIVLTKDRQPLVWHDPVIQPAKCADTGPVFAADPQYPYVGKLVHDLTLPQIRTLDCGQPLSDFPNAEVVRGNTIATLSEVFTLTDSYRADVRYNIETK